MILDMCCGSKMFYYDKSDERVLFCDIRDESHILCDGRSIEIKPDIVADFRELPFGDCQFNHVVFDPPHLEKAGDTGWQVLKYGKLGPGWGEDIKKGFSEAFRVLRKGGCLIFKWSEVDIKLSTILKLTDEKPVLGHRSGKQSKTHWCMFIK